jgi:hypothetical protein
MQPEVTRVVNMHPKMTTGSHKGENVSVMYGLAIIFQIKK